MIKKEQKEKGFTLVETMVVVVIFTVVMSFSLIVFLGTIRVQRAALSQQRLVNEISYAMRVIEKGIMSGDIEEGEITKAYVESLIGSDSVTIKANGVKTVRNGDRITVFIDSDIKLDENEENNIDFKLQTTALIR